MIELAVRRYLRGCAFGAYLGALFSSGSSPLAEPPRRPDPPVLYEPHHDDPGIDDSDLVEI